MGRISAKILEIFRHVFYQISVLLMTIGIIVGTILFLVFFTPVYIFRQFVRLQAFLYNRNILDGLLPARSCILAEKKLRKSAEWNIVLPAIYIGSADLEELRKILQGFLIDAKNSNGGPKFPELQKYFHSHFGFFFWKKDTTFSISNHVNEYSGKLSGLPRITEKEVFQISSELKERPFKAKRSPWEFVIVRNIYLSSHQNTEPFIGLFFIINHAMADGYSMENIFCQIGQCQIENMRPSSFKQNSARKSPMELIFDCMSFPIKAPYQMAIQFLQVYEYVKFSPFNHEQNNKKSSSLLLSKNKYFGTKQFNWDIIKDIKNSYNVSVFAVVLTGVAGGFRNFFDKKGFPYRDIFCAIPLPVPGKRVGLKNNLTTVVVRLPVTEKDPEKRLKIVNDLLNHLKNSTVPKFSYIILPSVGALPINLITTFRNIPKVSCVLTYFPGFEKTYRFNNMKIADTFFLGGLSSNISGIMLSIANYKETMRISGEMDGSIVSSDEEVDHFTESVFKQFEILNDLQSV